MIEIETAVLTAFITGFFSIIGTLYVQKSVTHRNNMKFLKEKGWSTLTKLTDSVTKLITSVKEAESKTIEEFSYHDVEINDIKECYKVMKESEPFIHIMGEQKIIRSFDELQHWLEELIKHGEKPSYIAVYRIEIRKISEPSAELIKGISKFMNS